MRYYVFFRPGPHEKALPAGLFWWEGPDGSRSLAARPPGHYNTGPEEIEWRIREAAAAIEPGLSDGMAFYGVGNHGGGPTKQNIASILSLRELADLPNLVFSHPQAFFEAALATRDDFPVARDELQYHSRGCYTSVAAIKATNRLAEHALLDAELCSSLAAVLVGKAPERDGLAQGWRTVLFNQFHDIMAGTSIRAACDEAVERNRLVIGIANNMARDAAETVAAHVDTSAPGQALVVINPLSWRRNDLVEAEVNWREAARGIVVEDEHGTELPTQLLRSVWSGGGRSARLLAHTSIGPCGYTALRVKPREAPARLASGPGTAATIDNGALRVTFGRGAEWIKSLKDVENGLEVGEGAFCSLVVLGDPSDTWSHGVDRFRDEIGRFEVVGEPTVVEWGPLRWTVRLEGAWGDSRAWQEFSLSRGRRQLDVRLEVDWHERHRMLKLALPTRVREGEATYEIPYGAIVRPATGDEEPAQRWVDVSGEAATDSGETIPYGVGLLNNCKYGFDILDSEIRMTVLRSPIYAFHDPAQVVPGETYEYTDQGRQVVCYSVVPHRATWREAEIVRRAAELNRPCLVLHEPAHSGRLPRTYTLVTTDRPNVDVEVVKPAERGEEIIIRLRETTGAATECSVILPGPQRVPLSFRGWEIKTIAVAPQGSEWQVRETDLLERDLGSQ
jgi:alpha-mannosidase